MASVLKTTIVQEPSSAVNNLTLDTSGGVTVGQNLSVSGTVSITGATTFTTNVTSSGTVVMSSPYTMRNKIINGAMVIDQRNAGASVTPADDTYTLDRWKSRQTTAGKFSVQQNAGSVSAPTGFTNYLGVTSLSAYSVSATDVFTVMQLIEGFNTADLAWGTANAQAVTISFWVRSSLTGTFGGSLRNNGGDRQYPFSYTINSANTWEYKTISVAGDTTGTWATGNTNGIRLSFGLGVGSIFLSAAGSWGSTGAWSATGATSVVGTNGATFYITGVQLERGTVATPFEYRNYQQELAMCQRYYEKINYGGNGMISTGQAYSTSQAQAPFSWKVTKRAAPSIAISSTLSGDFMVYSANGGAYNCTYGFANITTDCCYINITGAASSPLVAGNAALLYVNTANQFISISAEL